MKVALHFLYALFFGSTGPVFLTSLANDKSASRRVPPQQIVTREYGPVEAFATRWDKAERALYFGVATLKPGTTRRAKENVHALVCLHADLDFKSIDATPAEIERALKQLPLRPTCVVFSGHGLHLYWKIRPTLSANAENIARVERLLKRLAAVLAGDPAVCEVARLMRLPGSHNTKFGDWIEVRIIELRRWDACSLDQLEAWLMPAEPVLRRRNETKRSAPCLPPNTTDPFSAYIAELAPYKPPIDVAERLDAMQYHGPGDSAIHPTQLSVTAALLTRGWLVDDVVFHVLRATIDAAGTAGRGWDWFEEERGLRAMCASWLKKHPRVFFRED